MMFKLTGGLAAVAVAAAVALISQPVSAQTQPRVLIQRFGPASQIGVTIREVTQDDATKAKLAQPVGVYIESVRENSPAATAGLKSGDIVVDFDGERVRSANHFARLVDESAPNRQVEVVIIRGTSKQTMKVVPEASNRLSDRLFDDGRRDLADRLRQLPRNFNFDVDPDNLRRGLVLTGPTLGVGVTPLTDQLAGYFGVKQGVLVSSVSEKSPAADAGLKAGDVITAVNGQNVANVADVTRALREAREGNVELSVTRDKKPITLKTKVPDRTTPRALRRSGVTL